ncbi:hypothetical protein B9Z65_3472 [Elsinoe australis]|uniref:Uncharacterized protein n=1 Tax=Elsinoe australis TaxID=40998 RepID=A0A2P8A1M3_9PEZI|nr:hypothetical protein B9Z65_3472 [Elsinoe australis]
MSRSDLRSLTLCLLDYDKFASSTGLTMSSARSTWSRLYKKIKETHGGEASPAAPKGGRKGKKGKAEAASDPVTPGGAGLTTPGSSEILAGSTGIKRPSDDTDVDGGIEDDGMPVKRPRVKVEKY